MPASTIRAAADAAAVRQGVSAGRRADHGRGRFLRDDQTHRRAMRRHRDGHRNRHPLRYKLLFGEPPSATLRARAAI
jgi:hypothetical protein